MCCFRGDCCFTNFDIMCISITGIVLSIVNMGFSSWELSANDFLRNSTKGLFKTAFSFNVIIIAGFIATLVIYFIRKGTNYNIFNKIARIICIGIRILCLLSLIFILIHFIIQLYDLVDLDKDLPSGYHLDYKFYVELIIPTIISIILLPIIDMIARILYNRFTNDETKAINNISSQINQKGIDTNGPIQNLNNYNPQIVNPVLANNQAYQVDIQQAGNNMNK